MSTTAVTDPAEAYLAEVRRCLAGLTDDEREDLLDDPTAHVHQVAASDARPLDEVLGTPETFAAELLASAGLATGTRPGVSAAAQRAVAWLTTTAATARDHPWARGVAAFLPELRPAWWVARGWLVVYGLWLIGAEEVGPYLLPELLDSTVLGLVGGVTASVASVHLARRTPSPRRWRGIVNGLAIVAAVVLFVRADDLARAATSDDGGYIYPPQRFGLTHPDGSAITNIYAYDESGQPLDRVRLYDQTGRPIEIGDATDAFGGAVESDDVYGPDGLPVTNLYPIDQFTTTWSDIGQTEVRHPVVDPALSVPPLPPDIGTPAEAPATTVPGPGS